MKEGRDAAAIPARERWRGWEGEREGEHSILTPHSLCSPVSIATSGGGVCTRLKVGDNVWGDIGANTHAKRGGAKTKELGGYGEYAVALESQLAVMPRNLGFAEAGSLPKPGRPTDPRVSGSAGSE